MTLRPCRQVDVDRLQFADRFFGFSGIGFSLV